MCFSEEYIRKELNTVKCHSDDCKQVAKETAIKLLGDDSGFIEEVECKTLQESLEKINNFLNGHGLAIIWIDSGSMSLDKINYRAMHFQTIYCINTLRSFSIWENDGLQFYDGKYTKDKIEEAIRFFKVIRIHHYGVKK